MPTSDYVHLDDCTVLGIREKSIRIRRPDGSTHFLPRSVLANDVDKLQEGDVVTISVQEWFARKNDLEEDE